MGFPTYRRNLRANLAARRLPRRRARAARRSPPRADAGRAAGAVAAPRSRGRRAGARGARHGSGEAAAPQARRSLFLTPHMGCFEIAAQYASMHMPFTVLYRPPKIRWLEPLMREGRSRANVRLAPADITGVRVTARRAARGSGRLPAGPGAGRRRGRVGRVLRPARLHHDARGEAAGRADGACFLGSASACRAAGASTCSGRCRAAACPARQRDAASTARSRTLVRECPASTCGATTATSPRREAAAVRGPTRLNDPCLRLRCGWCTSCLARGGDRRAIGTLLFWLIPERRKVTRINLAKCFPTWPGRARSGLRARISAPFARSFVDHGLVVGAAERIRELVQLARPRAPQGAGRQDASCSRRISSGSTAAASASTLDGPMAIMYSRQKDPVFDRVAAPRAARASAA